MSGEGNDNGKSERIEYGWNDKTKRIKEAKKRERKGKNTNTKRSAMKAKEKKKKTSRKYQSVEQQWRRKRSQADTNGENPWDGLEINEES